MTQPQAMPKEGAEQPRHAKELDNIPYRVPESQRGLAVIGEFGRGKTTLLNALLGQDLLPTDGFPMSKGVWVVTWGEPVTTRVHYANGEETEIELAEIKLAGLEETMQHQVQRIEVSAPFEDLPIGLCLMESPGMGEINPAHEGITDAILSEAVAVLLVMDASLAMSGVEQAWLQRLPGHIQRLFIVINKVDLLETAEIDEVASFVAQQIGKLRLSVRAEVFLLSARQILDREEDEHVAADWQRLVDAIGNLAEIELRVKEVPVSPERLRQEAVPSESEEDTVRKARRRDELERSSKLLLQVIDDQAADILQMVRDGYETKSYFLAQDLKSGRKEPEDVERELREWVRKEEQRAYERLIKLFENILEEVQHWTAQEIEAQPDVSPVQAVAQSLPRRRHVSGRLRALGAMGSGTAAVAASRVLFFRGALGTLASVSAGGLVALAVWSVLGRLSQIPDPSQFLEEASAIILKSFEDNVRRNTAHLKALVREQLDEALV